MTNTNELHHYTSLQGFKSIAESTSLRMTKSTFLNDPDDCTLLAFLVEKYIHDNDIISNPEKLFDNMKNEKQDKIPSHLNDIKQLFNAKCDPVSYIQFIQHHIPLYVISFSKKDDSLPIWICYGQDGLELTFNYSTLLKTLQKTLRENEYLIASDVIYTNKETTLDTIKLPSEFSEIMLIDESDYNIFYKHKDTKDPLYGTTEIVEFIKPYIKNYIYTLDKLLSKGSIQTNNPTPENVFHAVFEYATGGNVKTWQRDLTLYMIVLSALIKHDSYENEKEHRIVYFECNTSRPKIRQEEHEIKHMHSGSFLYPYINLFSSKGSENSQNTSADLGAMETVKSENTKKALELKSLFLNTLESVTLSPLSRNIPINPSEYTESIKAFLIDLGYNGKVHNSTHNIRW